MFEIGILGVIPAIMSICTIKKCEKAEETKGEYGVLLLKHILLFFATSIFLFLMTDLNNWIQCLSLIVTGWMLTTTSYMDQRCGKFHIYIAYYALIANVFLLIAYLMFYRPSWDRTELIIILAINSLLFAFRNILYSHGDYIIICSIEMFYLFLNPYTMPFFLFTMLFFAFLYFLARNIFRLKESLKRRMPFTLYISLGFITAVMIYKTIVG